MLKKFLEKFFKAHSKTLETTIETVEDLSRELSLKEASKEARKYWHMLGPGLTTGASDDDPAGVTTYSQAGAQFGNQILWMAPYSFPIMAVTQEMCARIGMVTGQGLAANIRRYYPKWALYFCTAALFIANTFNIGADLGAMAKATQLVLPELRYGFLIVIFTLLSLILQIFTSYKNYAKYLKWLALILLAYVFSGMSLNLDWGALMNSAFSPTFSFSRDFLFIVTAVLGTTISPYLFFWQTSQEVEEEILEGRKTVSQRRGATERQIRRMRIDVWAGMFFSNLVMFFIIATCAAVLFGSGITTIESAAQAAAALRPFAGERAYLLFTLGIVGTGFLAVPVLAGSASYALSECFGWPQGLYRKLKQARAFYGVLIVSMLIGLGLNFIHLDPIKAMIYSAVLNGIVSPIVLFFIVRLSSNKKIMGEYVNRPWVTVIGWFVTVLMLLAAGTTVGFSIFP